MWPFKRNKKDQSVYPEEVQNYYQSENRERKGIAWLLAVGTIVGTILLAAALFFGGRWVYRTVFDSDTGSETTTTEQTGNGQVGDGSATDERDDNTENSDNTETTPLPGNGSGNESPTPGDETITRPDTSSDLPSSGDALPRTGPAEE